jgi:DNA-binding response OmpR family regulator
VATGRHVLIVEDDEITSLVISEYLTACGYRTTIARTGTEGISKFMTLQPDMALVDVLLPKKDGFDVCFVMKASEHGKKAPVMIMSAIYRDEEQAEAYARGLMAAGFIKKPFDLDVLVERVQALIGPP